MIAELANPALKSIYKGKDAFSEYGDPEYWKGVGHAGKVGFFTSVAHGGTTGYIMKQSGAYADAQSVMEEIESLKNRADKMDMDTFAQAEEKYNRSRKQNYQVLERVLQNASAKQRADIIKRYELSEMFAEDGSMQADFAKQLDTGTEAKYNKRYYNRVMRNNEDIIESDLERLNGDLAVKYGEKTQSMSVFDGELSEKGRSVASKVKKFIKIASEKSGKDIGFVITDGNVPQFRGVNVGDRIYMSADTFEKGDAYEVAVEETMHFAEGSEEHNALVKLLAEDGDLEARAVDEVLGANGYGFDGETIRDIGRRIEAGAVIEGESMTAEELRYSQKYFKFLHKNFPGESESKGSDAHKWATLWAARQDVEVGDQALASYHGRWYLIQRFNDADSGYQVEAFIPMAEYKKIAKEIAEYGRSGKVKSIQGETDWNDSSDKPSYSFGREGSSIDRTEAQYGREDNQVQKLDKSQTEGQERSGRDGGGDRESGGADRQGDPVTVTREEWLAYEEYRSEVGAHMGAELLGNEAFIDKIIRENGSLGEKILGKIIAFKEALGRIGDPEAQAQHKRLVEAEKLYLDAIEAAGKKYVNGKIVSADDDEEKENTAEGGGKYSFAGPKAKTADKMKLATAQEMLEQGVDSETVRKETGWFRGYDGKWRFEISDFEASLIENPNLEKHTDDGEVYFTGKLSDILDHKELFEAYPELKDINIVIQKTDFGVYGIYQPNSNYITLSIEHFKRATKEYYDYANGGRKAEIERIEATPEYQAYNSFYEMDGAEDMDPEEWLRQEKELRDRFFNSDLGKRYYQLMWGKTGFVGEKYEFGWGTGGKETLLHELQHAVQRIEGFASGTSTQNADYSRTAGEIEARDTEARTNLTAEQRKNTRPDIDREDVVFAESSDRSLSIAVSENGKPVVVVNDDITRYASNDKELVKLVKQSIGKLPYVAIGKQKIEFVRDTKKEVTFSRYTQQIRKNAPDVYKDKMRLFNHPSEIILATTNYINEGLKHSRTDDIIDFARGELLVDILGNQYTAEVVIGFTKTGVCELHDVVKMVPTSFKYKARDAVSAISHIGEHSQKRSSLGNSIAQNSDLSTPKAKFSLKSDAEYLRAVESGDMEAAQRMVDEAAETAMPNSLVKGEDGKLLYVYHGSPSKFNEFSYRKMNTNGNAHGRGFYFTEKRSLAEGYETDGGQLLKGFLNIEKPLSEETVTIKKSELLKLVKATCEEEARSMVEGGSYDTVKDAILDTWISNYVMTYGMNLNDAYREVVDIIYSGNDNDVDMIAEITNAGAGHERVLRLTHDLLGYGGTIYTAQDGSHEFVALVSNLFKSAEPVTYDDNGKVIPLSERFDVRRRDLRYSLKDDGAGIEDWMRNGMESDSQTSANPAEVDTDGQTEVDIQTEGSAVTKRPTSYTREEARAMVDRILEISSFEGTRAKLAGGNLSDVIKRAHALLNSAEAGKRAGVALHFADYVIDHAILVDEIDPWESAPYIETVDLLKIYTTPFNSDFIYCIENHTERNRYDYLHGKRRRFDLQDRKRIWDYGRPHHC